MNEKKLNEEFNSLLNPESDESVQSVVIDEEFVDELVTRLVALEETPQIPGPKGDRGEKGDKGDPGIQGPKGDRGDTGITGPKGDTGIQGPKGDKGDRGEKGDTGIQGPKGDKGDRGDPGIQGPKGDQGDRGERGIQGPKGDKGDPGVQGPKGETGPKGDAGIQGPKGDKGDRGEKGEKGDKGDRGDVGPQGPPGRDGISPDVKPFNENFSKLSTEINKRVDRLLSTAVFAGGGGSGSYWLNDLGDTDFASISNAQDGQVLVFDTTLGKWKAGAPLNPVDQYARNTANAAYTQANAAYNAANNIVIPDPLPPYTANSYKILSVNSSNTGAEWIVLPAAGIYDAGSATASYGGITGIDGGGA